MSALPTVVYVPPRPITAEATRELVRVKCPYCSRMHKHGIARDEFDGAARVSDCARGAYIVVVKTERLT